MCVCVCARACVCVCARACVRVRVCVQTTKGITRQCAAKYLGLTLVANTVLRGDAKNGGLVFRIWGLSSEQSVPVSVSIYDRLDAVSSSASVFCQPASIAHDLLQETGWLGSDFFSVCLETRWLGQKPLFLSPGMTLYLCVGVG